ncbi:ATP-dependent DNA helicase [Pyrobaculum neutrophilum]|uniref:DEAD_2 domain protein n=1 Tax=Pyrobaculum neutrophilum (strain DSM 2338 / JCM 9278 / NBRC 100436 / V24Sta) TaxID=444157 RepID=B1YAK6_PYRNV|nr:ATP-dependent DNA helicase [Pyrobaculum neutrophilum]ACB40655.1 DEAD_2 domain protein [Pyrobaculum neutrophilum V24Sta]
MEPFPYGEFRPRQREIFERVYETLTAGGVLLINAPTGLGKTAAVLSAAVKYIAEGGGAVHYVVRTRSELEPPVRELSRIIQRGFGVDYAVIKSRQDMCCYPQLRRLSYLEFLAECNLLRSSGRCAYYPPRDVETPLKSVDAYVRFLCAAGSCPYEYAKERLARASLVISTYYYVFGRERPALWNKAVIVDEAHSLFEAVAHLHAVEIPESEVRAAYREAKKFGFLEEAAKIYGVLTFIRRTSGVIEVGDVLGLVGDLELDAAILEISRRKAERRLNPYTPLLLLKELREALRSGVRYFGEVKDGEGGRRLVLQPLDPATLVKNALRGVKSVVYLSGTLPVELFAEALGEAKYRYVDIPFGEYIPRQNYLAVVDIGVTTRYGERGEEMYVEIARRLAHAINISPGGVLAVFPSYEVLKGVKKYLRISIPHWYEGGEAGLGDLPDKFFIGAVARGRYTEGVEYVRDGRNLLSTVVVVGVPYPEPTPYLERRVEMLKPRLGEKAWGAVYLYQAVVAVRQAMGRLFRSPKDRGVLIFLDRRYAEPELWGALADVLQGSLVVNSVEEVLGEVERFLGGG